MEAYRTVAYFDIIHVPKQNEKNRRFPCYLPTQWEEILAQLHPFPGRVGNESEALKKEASDRDEQATVVISCDILVFR